MAFLRVDSIHLLRPKHHIRKFASDVAIKGTVRSEAAIFLLGMAQSSYLNMSRKMDVLLGILS